MWATFWGYPLRDRVLKTCTLKINIKATNIKSSNDSIVAHALFEFFEKQQGLKRASKLRRNSQTSKETSI